MCTSVVERVGALRPRRYGRVDEQEWIPSGAGEKLSQVPDVMWMEVEELDPPPTTTIELNTAPDGEDAVWQNVSELSTGQKATAVLVLRLLDSDAPLVVDQVQGDLDSRFITRALCP